MLLGNHLPPSRALEELTRVYAENRELRTPRTFRDFSEAWPYIRTKVESKMAKESHLEVKLLGMSMEYAWSFVRSMMLQRLKDGTSEKLTLDIAMLDPTWEGVSNFTSTWATTARSHHDRIETFIRSHEADFARRKWKMRLHVYRHAPNWHGFLLDESTLFVSSCRWLGGEILGGENSYELYESENAMGREKIEQFKGWFGYCCHSGLRKT